MVQLLTSGEEGGTKSSAPVTWASCTGTGQAARRSSTCRTSAVPSQDAPTPLPARLSRVPAWAKRHSGAPRQPLSAASPWTAAGQPCDSQRQIRPRTGFGRGTKGGKTGAGGGRGEAGKEGRVGRGRAGRRPGLAGSVAKVRLPRNRFTQRGLPAQELPPPPLPLPEPPPLSGPGRGGPMGPAAAGAAAAQPQPGRGWSRAWGEEKWGPRRPDPVLGASARKRGERGLVASLTCQSGLRIAPS
ncbi:translation initiation factor IF-2-like [Sphaerodactylus townsendi]|uniref:translation initiation factor IF-2-like n=1 Tax=Sphaerodactylus townsendi TaxID=933632 RepID=UPI002026EC48|nr:translation initiation factor IF-2-like [Sphaerodactylus townsendi]